MVAVLQQIVTARLDAAQRGWLERAIESAKRGDVSMSFPLAPRKCGSASVVPTSVEVADLEAAHIAWTMAVATVDELARMLLLREAATASADPVTLAAEWYRLGDNAEKRAVLRALSLLPEPARFVEVGVASCRTSVQTVFEAICCENPYPADHFSDLAFNQLVLKALFTGVALDRIVRLDERNNADLRRMAEGYASERRAAGRSVPADIGRVTDERP